MSLKVIWLDEGGVEGTPCFVAFPGVGDIGILTAELLEQLVPSKTVAHVLDPSLPPLAQLDENGVLQPPHHRLVRLETDSGPAHVLIGAGQSGLPHLQHATALGLLEAMSGAKEIVGLAGFRASAEDRRTFWVATSSDDATSFESEGRTVSRTEPQAGCIGALALLVSLAPHHGLSGSLAVSTTVGRARTRARLNAWPRCWTRPSRSALAPCQTWTSICVPCLKRVHHAWCKITSLS